MRRVDFLGGFRTAHRSSGAMTVDPDYVRRLARVYDDGGFDWTLIPYGSAWAGPEQVAGAVLAHTNRLKAMIAHRPGVVFPTTAARALATLDQLHPGRVGIHVIAGGNDAEQRREGDYLTKAERYRRAAEYVRLLKRIWAQRSEFSHSGEYYTFESFRSDIQPTSGITVSVGGSSSAAHELGGAEGDVYALWGEPLADASEQITAVHATADMLTRPRPRIWVSLRVVLAPTDELAWRKAEQVRSAMPAGGRVPENEGSRRLLDIAARGAKHDRALWTGLAKATGGGGNSSALVGSPETITRALLDYVGIGCDILGIRGFDALDDAVELTRHVIPAVREQVR